MLSNEQLVEMLKANIVTSVGGQVSADDVVEFVDLSVEQNQILREIRVESGIAKSRNIDSIELGDPTMVAATEATAPDAADIVAPSMPRLTLTPVEVLSAFNVSFDMLRKNVEGDNLNDTLNRVFAKRWGKDSVLAAFSGDSSLGATSRLNKTLRVFDGIITQAVADADVHDYSIPATPTYGGKDGVFNNMLALLPKDYRDQRDELGFFCSQDVVDDYNDEIGERQTTLGDTVILRGDMMPYKGVKLYPVFGQDNGKIILTLKRNLVVGFGQEMEMGRDIYYRTRTIEVTIYGSLHSGYISSDAFVLGAA